MRLIADAFTGLGTAFRETGHFREAADWFAAAASVRQDMHDQAGQASALIKLGSVRMRMGMQREAEAAFYDALIALRGAGVNAQAMAAAALKQITRENQRLEEDFLRHLARVAYS